MKKRFPLFWKLYPPFLLIVLIPLLAISWYADFSMRRFFMDQTAINLEARANLLKDQMTGYLLAEDWKNIDIVVQTGREIHRHADYGDAAFGKSSGGFGSRSGYHGESFGPAGVCEGDVRGNRRFHPVQRYPSGAHDVSGCSVA